MANTPFFFTPAEISYSDRLYGEIDSLSSRLDGACLFGAGAIGRELLLYFRKAGLRALHFIDNNQSLWGGEIDGLKVLSLAQHLSFAPDAPVVLALANGFRAVRAQCRQRGIEPIPQYIVRSHFGICPFGKRMPATGIESDTDARAAIGVWEDGASAERYRALVRFQALFDDAELPAADPHHYFSPDYVPRKHLRSVVDVGACDGDTLADFLAATHGDFDSYHAFEADPRNFTKLTQKSPAGDSRIKPYNMALGDHSGVVRFRSFGTLLSSIGDDGDIEIPVDTLDSVLGADDITLIKVDVEGYEPRILTGMREIIRRRRPALAISIYHQVDHLWSLPLWIHRLDLGYSLRLACHGDLYSEAVCYAVP